MIAKPDLSPLDMGDLPDWPEYASAESFADGQRGVIAATMTPPNREPVTIWIPVDVPSVSVGHKTIDLLVKDGFERLIAEEEK